MLTIYHNPRCRKSREALQYLETTNEKFTTVLYLEQPFTKEALKTLLKKLNLQPEEILRKQEALWKSNFKGKPLSEEELLDVLVVHPKLIERPIIASATAAVVGRPLEHLIAFLNK
jgi:arsenate reductase